MFPEFVKITHINSYRYDLHTGLFPISLLSVESDSKDSLYQWPKLAKGSLITFRHNPQNLVVIENIHTRFEYPMVLFQIFHAIPHAECRKYFAKLKDTGKCLVFE